MNSKSLSPKILVAAMVLTSTTLHAQNTGSDAVVSDSVLLYALIGVAALLVIVNFVLLGSIKSFAADKRIWEVVKERNTSKAGIVALIAGLSILAPSAMAQETAGATADAFVMGSDLFYALLTMNIILLLLVIYQVNVLRSLLTMIKGEEEKEAETVMDSWAAALTDVVPIEKEEEIMFEHEHDGIRELDNNLPPWWLWGFYFTIVFGIGYLIYYHGMDGKLQTEEYMAEIQKAEAEKAAYLASLSNLIDENNVEAAMDEASLAEGRKIWVANCVACHGDNGEGGVGPNMTDPYWLHGGGIKNIFKTIKYGVPAKGMIPWEAQLSPGQMRSVASYILSLEGTNPAGAKEPQGEIWKPDASNTGAPETQNSDEAATEENEIPEGSDEENLQENPETTNG